MGCLGLLDFFHVCIKVLEEGIGEIQLSLRNYFVFAWKEKEYQL